MWTAEPEDDLTPVRHVFDTICEEDEKTPIHDVLASLTLRRRSFLGRVRRFLAMLPTTIRVIVAVIRYDWRDTKFERG